MASVAVAATEVAASVAVSMVVVGEASERKVEEEWRRSIRSWWLSIDMDSDDDDDDDDGDDDDGDDGNDDRWKEEVDKAAGVPKPWEDGRDDIRSSIKIGRPIVLDIEPVLQNEDMVAAILISISMYADCTDICMYPLSLIFIQLYFLSLLPFLLLGLTCLALVLNFQFIDPLYQSRSTTMMMLLDAAITTITISRTDDATTRDDD